MAAPIKMKPVFCFSAILVLFFTCYSISAQDHGHAHGGHGHAHDHGHGQEEQPSHFKYSQAANEPVAEGHGHGHGHDDGHAHGHGHDDGHAHGHKESEDQGHVHGEKPASSTQKNQKDTGLQLWLVACGSTAIVSVAPVFILLFIPIEDTHTGEQPLLKVLLAFASGGLLGDAFLHLIPHALSPHSHHGDDEGHGHSHDHAHSHEEEGGHDHSHDMGIGLWVLAGIVAFLVVEKFVRFVKGGHGHSHGHGHAHTSPNKDTKETKDTKKSDDDTVRQRKKSDTKEENDEKEVAVVSKGSDIKVAGYLNLAADFAHNFTDGLAIGASYLAGRNIGIITTITILLHEVPHEVGDFAILVQSGCTKKKAMMLQFTTAFGAMFGTMVSLMAEGIGDAAVAWILPFTAGGFIYIATVSVIPELLEDCKPWQTVKEIIALLVGIYMMVLIAEYE